MLFKCEFDRGCVDSVKVKSGYEKGNGASLARHNNDLVGSQ